MAVGRLHPAGNFPSRPGPDQAAKEGEIVGRVEVDRDRHRPRRRGEAIRLGESEGRALPTTGERFPVDGQDFEVEVPLPQ